MVLELHIWGPAFGLPSIDAQCLAAIAYFALAVPEKDAEWVVIADSDPLMVPTHELPAVWTGARWISGFRNIVEFLRQYSNGEWDLDRWLDKQERADCIAFSSFIESHGQPLIDLSLYVSSQNYGSATMPAYSSFLGWPNQWIVPPKIRTLAKKRTEHLGLSSLDLLTAQEEERQQDRETAAVRATSRIPTSLATKPRDTVSGLLGKTSQRNRIRLEGMTEAFVVPLEELRSKKRYLLSDQLPTTLDCLALAYLSLAIVPDLPVSWLRDAVTTQSAGLVGYTERLRTTCFGGRVDVGMAFASSDPATSADRRHRLPWQAPARLNVGGIGLRVWEAVLDSIPVVRDIRTSRRLQQVGQEQFPAGQEQEMVLQIARAQRYNTYLSVGTVVGGVGLMVWYMFSAGLLAVSRGEPTELEEEENEEADGHQPQPSAFGDAGSILGI